MRLLNAVEQERSNKRKSDAFKIIGMLILTPVLLYITVYLDYQYRKAIVKDAIEEVQKAKEQ